MGLILVTVTLAGVVGLYFRFNPLNHSSWFIFRRFANWFPLGMSYAFLYMARLNLNASQKALAMDNKSFGIIFAAGATTYALSLVVNGPVVDKIGGKKGIVISTLGACVANIALGFATYLMQAKHLAFNITLVFSILYSLNMYFQSFGAVSIIKVKAYWFHVRERGMFGAIFGALISLGSYLAFDWGQAIVEASKVNVTQPTFLQSAFQFFFNVRGGVTDAIWLVYFIPAGILLVWALIDIVLIRDTPAQAGLEDLETHDASMGEMQKDFSIRELLGRVFLNPVLVMVALVEFANGVIRNGVVQWYKPFVEQVGQSGTQFFHDNWGLFLFLSGISGGFVAGHLSDRYFHSRRGPPVALSAIFICVALMVLGGSLFSSSMGVGLAAVAISFLTIAIHSLMSGTAAADFGGRKATATAAGVTDAFVYLGAAIQSFGLGFLTARSWEFWPAFLVPFAIGAVVVSLKMWRALPEATKKYLLIYERVTVATEGGMILEERTTGIEVTSSP